MRNIIATAVMLLAFEAAGAENLVAVVDLKFLESTDRPAMYMCFTDDNCGVWATHNLYRATIRKVISGSEPRKTVLVLHGRHALRKVNLRGVIATLQRLEANDENGADYRIVERGEERPLFCFERHPDDTQGFELKAAGKRSLTCYDAQPREDDAE